MKNLKYIVLMLVTGCWAGAANAEFGVSVGGSFDYKASFESAPLVLPPANNPGLAAAGSNHFYDDGYNRVDSSGSFGGQTTFWGYIKDSQYDAAGDGGNGTITMSSAYSTMHAGHSAGESDGAQPALEAYWKTDLAGEGRWNIGFRAALGWQHIEVDSAAHYGTSVTTVSDQYALAGVIPPGSPFSGSYEGPNALLGDDPMRTVLSAPGSDVMLRQSIEADLFTLNLGAALSIDLSERLSTVISAGPTLAWIRSDFSCSSDLSGRAGASDSETLAGAYAAADLQYRIGERSGLFFGVARSALQNFSQQADVFEGELEFDDSYAFRVGLFFR